MEKTMLEKASRERPTLGSASPSAGAAFRSKEKPAETNLGRMSSRSLYPRQGSSSLCRLLSTTLSFSDGSVPGENGKGRTYY